MPTLVITKTYQDGNILNELDLDNIKDDVETFINTTKLDSDNIQDDGIQEGKLASSVTDGTTLTRNATTKKLQVKDDGIDTTQIATDAVTADKIAANAVGSSEIAANAVGSSEIATNAVGSDEITSGAVTNPKIATSSVSWVKRVIKGNGTTVINGDIGDGATINNSVVAPGTLDILGSTQVTITTRGGPVWIGLRGNSGNGNLQLEGFGLTTVPSAEVRFKRSGTTVYRQGFLQHIPTTGDLARIPVGACWSVDFPAAGTYTYNVFIQALGGRLLINSAQFVVFEM